VLAVCILALPPFLRYRAAVERDFRSVCMERIGDFTAHCAARSAPASRIIAIGGSLLICAVPSDEEMESLAQHEGYGEIRFLRLSRIQSSFEHFLPMMERVIAARPDILLIDSDILSFRLQQPEHSKWLEEYGEFCRERLKESLHRFDRHRSQSRSDREMAALTGAALLDSLPARNAQFFSSYREVIVHRKPRGALSPGDPILARLKLARARGIRVILLELPRSRQAEMIMPARHLQKSRELRRQLEQECGVRTLEFPYRFPLDMYRDYSHLTGPGAERYSRWLIAQTVEMAGGKGRP
jgi:hypothetical protein